MAVTLPVAVMAVALPISLTIALASTLTATLAVTLAIALAIALAVAGLHAIDIMIADAVIVCIYIIAAALNPGLDTPGMCVPVITDAVAVLINIIPSSPRPCRKCAYCSS